MRRTSWKAILGAMLLGAIIFLPTSIVSAYPLEDWPYSHNPPPRPGTEPPAGLPPLPPSGQYLVDSPSADFYAWNNAGNSLWARQRGGAIAEIWDETPPAPGWGGTPEGSWISIGSFQDHSEEYGWPYQVLPLGNGTINDVSLIVNITFALYGHNAWLQYSLDGQQSWKPTANLSNKFDLFGANVPATYHVPTNYLVNVTTLEIWTPQKILSSSLYVRLYTEDAMNWDYRIGVDYIGLKYNWTTAGASPIPNPIYHWKNSTLGHITFAQMIVGGFGVLGFIGLIATPAIGILLARRSDNRVAVIGKTIFACLIFFTLFLVGIGI